MQWSCIEELLWEWRQMSETFINIAFVTLTPTKTAYKPLYSNLHVQNFYSHLVGSTFLFKSGYTYTHFDCWLTYVSVVHLRLLSVIHAMQQQMNRKDTKRRMCDLIKVLCRNLAGRAANNCWKNNHCSDQNPNWAFQG